MSQDADVTIVGGGIAGLCVALAAADRGLRVQVLDRPRPGAASRASAGMLAPLLDGLPSAVLAVAIAARDLFPGFLLRLADRGEAPVPLNRLGVLELFDLQSDERVSAALERTGGRSELLDQRALAALEPGLAHHSRAVLHAGDGAVDARALMGALESATRREPLVQRVAELAKSVEFAPNPRVTTDTGATYGSSSLVLASGAWVHLPGLPTSLPVRPVNGQLMQLGIAPLAHVTCGGGGYLVPQLDGLLVGATSEHTGLAPRTSRGGLRRLQAVAGRIISSLEPVAPRAHWSGLRPVTPDGLPIAGRDPRTSALFYACGYSRNGILFAPWLAGLLASELAAGKDLASTDVEASELAPFAITRFSPEK